jgi:hypothetical protein
MPMPPDPPIFPDPPPSLIKREPVAAGAILLALPLATMKLAMAFGVEITDAQVLAVNEWWTVIAIPTIAWKVRSRVTPA